MYWSVEVQAESQMGEGGWEVVNGLVEVVTKREMGNGGKSLYCSIESLAKGEMSKREGEAVDWEGLIEEASKAQMCDSRREIEYRLVEEGAITDVEDNEGRRKAVNWSVEVLASELELFEGCWKVVDGLVETDANG